MANAYRNLSPSQRRLAKRIVSIGRKRGASRQEIVAALSTARVEANYSNPRGGHGTSVGWRQETASSYPHANRRDVNASINRFYNETKPFRGKFRTSGELAQRVQRSAFPGRYDQHRGESKQILRALAGGGDVGGGGGTPGSTSVSFPNPKLGGTEMADMLRGQLAQAAPSLPPLGDIPAPAHTATNLIPMPKGPVLQPVATAAPPVEAGGLAEQLRQIEGLKGPKLDQLNVNVTPGTQGGGGGGGPSATGKVRIAAGADRPGVKTSGNVTHFLRRVAAFTGTPITVTTGTNHNRLTVNGNVSDHWSGNAADIAVPVDSAKGDRIAGAALVAAGVPRAKARQMVRRGGLWTLNHNGYRIQVIWRTNAGGNHHNHVHIGIRRG